MPLSSAAELLWTRGRATQVALVGYCPEAGSLLKGGRGKTIRTVAHALRITRLEALLRTLLFWLAAHRQQS